MDADDDALDKAIEGFVMFAFNSGEVCTSPTRALVQESIYERFMERALKRVAAIKAGSPLDTDTMLGAQCSQLQLDRILGYIKVGKEEGAEVLAGGGRLDLPGTEAAGYYVKPTVFKGKNDMRIFREEIFGPVLAVTTFATEAEAIAIANDTSYGLGAGVWSRNANTCFRVASAIKAGRVWTNCCECERMRVRACVCVRARASGLLHSLHVLTQLPLLTLLSLWAAARRRSPLPTLISYTPQTTRTRRTLPSAATRPAASGARRTRARSPPTSRSSVCS